MRALDDVLKQDGELEALSPHWAPSIKNWRRAARPCYAPSQMNPMSTKPNLQPRPHPCASQPATALESIREARHEAWVTNTQVNFCAKAYPTVPSGHADAPALSVLAAFLRNGFLHRSIREQGGLRQRREPLTPISPHSGSSPGSATGRDPRRLRRFYTLAAGEPARTARAEEAILSVMASLDKPGSPAGEAKRDFHERLFKRTAERKALRAGIVNTTLDDLRRVADTYLKPELASTAVITHTAGAETVSERGLNLTRQDLL